MVYTITMRRLFQFFMRILLFCQISLVLNRYVLDLVSKCKIFNYNFTLSSNCTWSEVSATITAATSCRLLSTNQSNIVVPHFTVSHEWEYWENNTFARNRILHSMRLLQWKALIFNVLVILDLFCNRSTNKFRFEIYRLVYLHFVYHFTLFLSWLFNIFGAVRSWF